MIDFVMAYSSLLREKPLRLRYFFLGETYVDVFYAYFTTETVQF